ncbi:MAG: hypothetical protein JOZ04_01840 [Acidimicrobiia bacterium]|nr:hypothetical protein [Acidimicrobiia bacterium]
MDRRAGWLLAAALVAAMFLTACGQAVNSALPLERAAVAEPTTSSTTTTLSAPPPTAPPPPPSTAPRPRPVVTAAPRVVTKARVRPPLGGGVAAYTGFGTWLDVFEWTNQWTNGKPAVGAADADRMASLGVQTLYIQAARYDGPDGVVEADRLNAIIQRAHAHGIRVVVWYLPTLTDVNADLTRLLAIAGLGVEGVAVDIESRDVSDPNERSARLVDLSDRLRAALPGRTLGAIVFPPTGMEVINPSYWPGFPWAGIAPDYDVWLPMAYWGSRSQASGWHDGYKYVVDNVQRTRNDLHNQGAPVHPIGGVGDAATAAEVADMVRAVAVTGSIGGSFYDYGVTSPDKWAAMLPLRR